MKGVFALNKLRARFLKGDEVKYISHLDTLRTFERAVRRADIPIAYSQGFNPRQQMSFGLPLSVGVTSNAEYVDIEMEVEISIQEFVQRLNNNLPKGFRVLDAEYVNATESLMASVRVASYEITVNSVNKMTVEQINQCISSFMQEETIFVEKEAKGKIKKIDIRPYIFEFDIIELDKEIFKIKLTLSAGSIFNLKPDLVIKAFNEAFRFELRIMKTHRIELLGQDGHNFIK